MRALSSFYSPQLDRIHQGKVRESFRIDGARRLLVATDRISAFDSVLSSAIPGKGAILNRLSAYWFERTAHIAANHLLDVVADHAMIVREVVPIRVEMIVRAFITGSAWRAYAAGRRTLSGVALPQGLERNGRLLRPVVTPTTKDKHDAEISPEEIVRTGLVSEPVYEEMDRTAQALFEYGSEALAQRGLLLVDTKYEFGLLGDELVLIDEIHTPDSSRFWDTADYERDPARAEAWDKEYARHWLLEERAAGRTPDALPDPVVKETQRRYRELYERIVGEPAPAIPRDAAGALVANLVEAGLLRDAWVALVMGSPADREHAEAIAAHLEPYGVAVLRRVVSAHKTPHRLQVLAAELNEASEPGAVVAIAGLSNGLGGALAANLAFPVINCPPFADREDMRLNVNSSLMMPSFVPAMTVLKPQNAALAALLALNLPRLRTRLLDGIESRRQDLQNADDEARRNGR